jgi:hypothetical protein
MPEATAESRLARYEELRASMGTMDLLQWRGNYEFSRVIRAATGEDANHASAVIRFPTYGAHRVWSIEALEQGLMVCPLSTLLERYDGACWWYPLLPQYARQSTAAAAWLMDRVGVTRYDFTGCLSHWRKLLGANPRPADAARLWCTESIFLAWRDGARLSHLQGIPHAPVPGRPMVALGLWGQRRQIL